MTIASRRTLQILFVVMSLLIVALVVPYFVNAQESTSDTATTTDTVVTDADDSDDAYVATLMATLQSLIQQVAALQERLNEMRGEVQSVREELRDNLREGMSDDDVERIQELLATDPDLYPEGLVTGYYGPLTAGAVQRFQARHNLPVTGVVDEATADFMESYLSESFGDDIPAGLLRAPGIKKKAERRLANDCDNGRGASFICDRLRGDFEIDDDVEADEALDAIEDAESEIAKAETRIDAAADDGEEVTLSQATLEEAKNYLDKALAAFDDDDFGAAETAAEVAEDLAKDARMKFLGKTQSDIDDEDDDLEVEVEVEKGVADVKIHYADSTEDTFEYNLTDEDEIIDAIVADTELTAEEIRAVIKFEADGEDDEDESEEDDEDDEEDD